MIDLHCHILPGLDDGPNDLAASLELARAAEAVGTRTIVATPHIRDDHPFDLDEIEPGVQRLNEALESEGVDLSVVAGAEVALSKIFELDDRILSRLCLGRGNYLLIESPYTEATDLLEEHLFGLQLRGFRPVLAHPERSPSFLRQRHAHDLLVVASIHRAIGIRGMGPQYLAVAKGRRWRQDVCTVDFLVAFRRQPGDDQVAAVVE